MAIRKAKSLEAVDDRLCNAVRFLEGQEVSAIFEDIEPGAWYACSRFLGPGAEARHFVVGHKNQSRGLDLGKTIGYGP